jgi:FPC/CPF motif-containing protein YcgG
MKKQIINFILAKNFPCVMAKAVATKGLMKVNSVKDLNGVSQITGVLKNFYQFIGEYRQAPKRLSSFIICLDQDISFDTFEKIFWKFLKVLNMLDKKDFKHDPRVSSNPNSKNFSFSIMEEAFFILALHPDSPRLARRFPKPMIVFNPHQQFENLRSVGMYARVRDIIRKKDKLLQGFINPMLNDFGEKSEVFQYTGRMYDKNQPSPLAL